MNHHASVVALFLLAATPAAASEIIAGISILGDTPSVVFDHLRDQVAPFNVPDAASAAWKEADGTVNLMIPSLENYRLRGPDLHSLRMDIHEVFSSQAEAQQVTESAFDYNNWLISPYTTDGRSITALTHMEWYGCLLTSVCTAPGSGADYTSGSWVTTLTQLASADGGATWQVNGNNAGHVVSNQFGYIWAHSEALKRRLYITALKHGQYDQTGLIAHTRIIQEGAYYYCLAEIILRDFTHADYANGVAPVTATGFIELRTDDVAQPKGWQIWVAGETWMKLTEAKVTATYGADPHNPISVSTNFGLFQPTPDSTPGQIVFDQVSQEYILVTTEFSRSGLFYSTTASLAAPAWTQGKLIGRSNAEAASAFVLDPRADANDPNANPPCSTYATGFTPPNYPSLLDATSPGFNFEFFNGAPELFYVVNPALYPGSCAGSNLARDLYRIPLRIAYRTAP